VHFLDRSAGTDRIAPGFARVRVYADTAGAGDPRAVVTRMPHGPVVRPQASTTVTRPRR
jgi:hypothetical protein